MYNNKLLLKLIWILCYEINGTTTLHSKTSYTLITNMGNISTYLHNTCIRMNRKQTKKKKKRILTTLKIFSFEVFQMKIFLKVFM